MAYSGARPQAAPAPSSSGPIKCQIKAGADTKLWVHRRHCCLWSAISRISRWDHADGEATESPDRCPNRHRPRLPTVWSSANACACDRNHRPLGWSRAISNLNPQWVLCWLVLLFFNQIWCFWSQRCWSLMHTKVIMNANFAGTISNTRKSPSGVSWLVGLLVCLLLHLLMVWYG